jgi:hypothetical protein
MTHASAATNSPLGLFERSLTPSDVTGVCSVTGLMADAEPPQNSNSIQVKARDAL